MQRRSTLRRRRALHRRLRSLNGNLTPMMERAEQFDTLGIKWRIYMDVGVNLLDYRGIAKSTGK